MPSWPTLLSANLNTLRLVSLLLRLPSEKKVKDA